MLNQQEAPSSTFYVAHATQPKEKQVQEICVKFNAIAVRNMVTLPIYPRSSFTITIRDKTSRYKVQEVAPDHVSKAYDAIGDIFSSNTSSFASATSSFMTTKPPTASASLTPKLVQQMIQSTFSTLGPTGKTNSPASVWYRDSGSSNHMTHSSADLTNYS